MTNHTSSFFASNLLSCSYAPGSVKALQFVFRGAKGAGSENLADIAKLARAAKENMPKPTSEAEAIAAAQKDFDEARKASDATVGKALGSLQNLKDTATTFGSAVGDLGDSLATTLSRGVQALPKTLQGPSLAQDHAIPIDTVIHGEKASLRTIARLQEQQTKILEKMGVFNGNKVDDPMAVLKVDALSVTDESLAAIKDIQRAVGLSGRAADGVFGPQTLRALSRELRRNPQNPIFANDPARVAALKRLTGEEEGQV
ncbi:hypothetical protein CO046_04780 [Candidatus Peregrinibacteria bacterium CG_4_9_14_0_2_um_filter_53_11]|nr:MAG: hypothetical protein CO046_04780 [Candidatus Peregrinibacteria bacterium CG_4_9_14_0_2_um_filter_53_11]